MRSDKASGHAQYGYEAVQTLVEKQIMVHEAQMIDGHRRVIDSLHNTFGAIDESIATGDCSKRIAEENNLAIQIDAANGIFHDKKFKGYHDTLLKRLKDDLTKELESVPLALIHEAQDCLSQYVAVLEGKQTQSVPLKHSKGQKMTPKEQEACLFAMNYGTMMNDRQRDMVDVAKTSEELTMFKKVDHGPLSQKYMSSFELGERDAQVFRDHSRTQASPTYPKSYSEQPK